MRKKGVSLIVLWLLVTAIPQRIFSEERNAEKFAQFLNQRGISNEIAVIVLSALPIFELRGGIPVAIHLFKMDWWSGFFFSYIGNLLPVFPLLLFLNAMQKSLRRIPFFDKFFNWLFDRTKRKSSLVEKYKALGLMVFVAIPLPVTGAWTGSIAATLFEINRLQAFIAIAIGVMIAGGIVTGLSLLGIWGGVIAGIVLLGFALSGMKKYFHGTKSGNP